MVQRTDLSGPGLYNICATGMVNRLTNRNSSVKHPGSTNEPNDDEDEINLRKLFEVLWDGKWWICGATLVSILVATAIAVMLPNVYRSEALLAPAQEEGAGGLSSLASQYGGLASLTGIDLGKRPIQKTTLGIETLKSRKFLTEFIQRHGILVPLFASKGVDLNSGALFLDSSIYDSQRGIWTRNVSPPRHASPSQQEAYEELYRLISIREDRDSGLVTLSVEHHSPYLAKQWVDWLVADINQAMMEQDVSKAQQTIQFLNNQIEQTSVADLQNVFYRLIEEQTKTVMLATVSAEYLLRTIDPAIAPEIEARPQRAVIVLLGAFLGLLLGTFAFLLIRNFRPNRQM